MNYTFYRMACAGATPDLRRTFVDNHLKLRK
jgi:hypothetical protein